MNEKRPDLPYEKATEEATKTIGKGLDLVDKASPAIADIYNALLGDRISAYRTRNADKFARETKRIIEERNLQEKRELPEALAAPLLEAAQSDPREELLKLFAALAVNAMDPKVGDDVRPEFIETVRKWQPFDLLVLQFAFARRKSKFPYFKGTEVAKGIPGSRGSAVQLSVDHLISLKCIVNKSPNGMVITAYGEEIMRAVSERPDTAT